MNIEAHKRAIRESLEIIRECIQKGIENRQRTIGFHCSVAAVDILEVFLHSKNLIDPGTKIKHDYFLSERKAKEKIYMDFPKKEEIISLIVKMEEKRNLLCYGKPQQVKVIEEYVSLFNGLKEIFDKMGVDYE